MFQTAGNRLFILPGKVNSELFSYILITHWSTRRPPLRESRVSSRVVACVASGTFYREIVWTRGIKLVGWLYLCHHATRSQTIDLLADVWIIPR